jgi:hypothetical protein
MTCLSAASLDVSHVTAVRSMTGTCEERLTGEVAAAIFHLHALQPLPHEDSGFERAYGLLATPEEHLAPGYIIYSHSDWYTHSMNGMKKGCDDSRSSLGRFHLTQIGRHDVRFSAFQRAMRSDVDVQTDESQSKESHRSER